MFTDAEHGIDSKFFAPERQGVGNGLVNRDLELARNVVGHVALLGRADPRKRRRYPPAAQCACH